MSIKAATPYLFFDGRATDAMDAYKEALGAEVTSLQRFGDMDESCPEAMRDRVMHASLQVGEALLFVSDGPDGIPSESGNVSVALDLDDPDAARRQFQALAAAGTIIEDLFEAPWGALFGVVEDEFGISWMFNCPL